MPRFWILFCLQTVGAGILLWKGVPFYRNFLMGNVNPGSRTALFLWAGVVIALIQPAYWTIRSHVPHVGKKTSSRILLGHIVSFLGRLVFVFVGGMFSAVFYAQYAAMKFTSGFLILMVLLFSLFCYTLELERVGKSLIDS